jgi:hypothetical protein
VADWFRGGKADLLEVEWLTGLELRKLTGFEIEWLTELDAERLARFEVE